MTVAVTVSVKTSKDPKFGRILTSEASNVTDALASAKDALMQFADYEFDADLWTEIEVKIFRNSDPEVPNAK